MKVIGELLLNLGGAVDDALPLHVITQTHRHGALLPGCLHPTRVANPRLLGTAHLDPLGDVFTVSDMRHLKTKVSTVERTNALR